tara:strand:+ start:1759 stop:2199 length:441 start_codon:yes stop_codon:yes gene_type:complete
MGPYDKDEGTVSGDDVFDGNPSSGSEKQEFDPFTGGAAAAGAHVNPMVAIPQSNDNATISLVLGIVTWMCHITAPFLCFTGCLAPFTTIGGVVFGHLGLRDANNMNGLKRTEAIIGLILNYLSVLGIAIVFIMGGALIAGIGSEIS